MEYKATELANKFPNKWFPKSSIKRLLKKFRDTGTVNRLIVSGRPRTEETVDLICGLIMSQEDMLQTYRTVREISRKTGIRLRCDVMILAS